MMLIESEPPSEKQLLKANSFSTKLIPNSTADSLSAANYRHLQLYNQSLGEKKMNSISQYQLSSGVNGNAFMPGGGQAAATLNRLSTLNPGLNQNLNHGTIRPHNQTTQLNGGLTPLQSSMISQYATISRAAHNQLNGGLNNGLNGGLLSQVPNSQPHLASLNTHQIYQQLTPLHTQINHLNQFQLANGIYAPAQFVGLEVGLDLNRNRSCCFCFSRRCNISRVSNLQRLENFPLFFESSNNSNDHS